MLGWEGLGTRLGTKPLGVLSYQEILWPSLKPQIPSTSERYIQHPILLLPEQQMEGLTPNHTEHYSKDCCAVRGHLVRIESYSWYSLVKLKVTSTLAAASKYSGTQNWDSGQTHASKLANVQHVGPTLTLCSLITLLGRYWGYFWNSVKGSGISRRVLSAMDHSHQCFYLVCKTIVYGLTSGQVQCE